jgi:hypothetical protein
MGVGRQHHPTAVLPAGKETLYRRLDGTHGRSESLKKISPQPGFDPPSVQSVTCRYTDHTVLAHLFCKFRT